MLCWFKSCCYVGFCSKLINTHNPSLSHKNTAKRFNWRRSAQHTLCSIFPCLILLSLRPSLSHVWFLSHTMPWFHARLHLYRTRSSSPCLTRPPLSLSHTQTHTQIQTTLGRLIPCLALGHMLIDGRGIGQQEWMRNSKWRCMLPSLLHDNIWKLAVLWQRLLLVFRTLLMKYSNEA